MAYSAETHERQCLKVRARETKVHSVENVLNGAQQLNGWNFLHLLILSPRQRAFAGNFIEQLDDLALARNLPHDFFLLFGHGRGGLLTG